MENEGDSGTLTLSWNYPKRWPEAPIIHESLFVFRHPRGVKATTDPQVGPHHAMLQ